MGIARSETRFGLEVSTTATRKERFAKPGREFRAINYRDRLGRFAKGQKVSGYLGYIGERDGRSGK